MIAGYLAILDGQLAARRVGEGPRSAVLADVRARLDAAARTWRNVELRKQLLLPALDEAEHLSPSDAPLLIRALVITAVRNSLIEDLASAQPYTPELKAAAGTLNDADLAELLATAVRHFEQPRRWDSDAPGPDALAGLREKYPRAARAMMTLANAHAAGTELDPPLPEGGAAAAGDWEPSVVSGVDPNLDPPLVAALKSIEEGRLKAFFCDSFCMLTRNPEKLYRVIDHVLGHGAIFLTHNHYLAPDYVARRERLLRPARDGREVREKLSQSGGLTARHRKALAEVRKGLR